MICYITQKEKRATATATAVVGQTLAGNSALLPSDVKDFAMLPAQSFLAGNSFALTRSRCRQNLKLGDFTFLICGVR